MTSATPAARSSLATYAPGTAVIGGVVALAFVINAWQPAISPLAVSVALGFLLVNLGWWPTAAGPAAAIASKRIMRIGVALLGLQLRVSELWEIGLRSCSPNLNVRRITADREHNDKRDV